MNGESRLCVLFLALDIEFNRFRGDAIHTRELARELARNGARVCLVTATPAGLVPDLGPEVVHVTRPSRSSIGLAISCSRIAREFGAQIIYERRFSSKVGAIVSALRHIPFVVEINGLVDEEVRIQGRRPSWVPSWIRRRWYRFLFRRAAAVVSVTEGIHAALVADFEVPSSRIFVVPNGANVSMFRPADRAASRKALGIEARHVACFVGDLAPWQGVDVLVRAAAKLRPRRPDALVVIVGDGMDRQPLEDLSNRLSAPVRFVGRVPYPEVSPFLAAADVIVVPKLPLRSGYSPLKVYEALACGRPAVASRAPGLEFIEQHEIGLLVTPGDPDELAEALERLFSSPEIVAKMGERGRAVVEREYSWGQTASRILCLLREISQGRVPRSEKYTPA